jgi:hypothetical protein
MTAGRIPGFSRLDDDGFRNYTRPEGKSGGHGVGWSEITPYTFKARGCWEETPVSIADPAGTEIDAKFFCSESGELKIILAPILRFSDKVIAKFEFSRFSLHVTGRGRADRTGFCR